MHPRDNFDPNTDPDRDRTDTDWVDREPPPDDIRTAGTTEIVPGAQGAPTTEPANEASSQPVGGMPGDGAGRRDEIGGKTGVYPFSEAPEASDAPVRTGAEFGQGDRGPEGYDDAGTSEGSPAATTQELLENKDAG